MTSLLSDDELAFQTAREHLKAGNPEMASEVLLQLCRTRKSAADFLYGASALAQLHDLGQAYSLLETGLEHHPDDRQLGYLQVRLLISSGRPDDALKTLDQVGDPDEEADEFAALSAAANYFAGNYGRARMRIRQIAGPQPSRFEHLLALSMIAFREERFEDVRKYAKKCVDLHPGDSTASALLAVAEALFEPEVDQEAPSQKAVVSGIPTDPIQKWAKGFIALRRGQLDSAFDLWEALLSNGPGKNQLRKDVAALGKTIGRQPSSPELPPDDSSIEEVLTPGGALLQGDRQQAQELWLASVQADLSDFEAIRALALLNQYWAESCAANGDWSMAGEKWRASAEYWGMILFNLRFHVWCAAAKTTSYGQSVLPADVAKACQLTSIAFLNSISSSESLPSVAGNKTALGEMRSTYKDALFELRAAELLSHAMYVFGDEDHDITIAGPRAMQVYSNLIVAQSMISASAQSGMDPKTIRRLRLAYSGSSFDWEEIDSKALDNAIEELVAVADPSLEERLTLAKLYCERAELIIDGGATGCPFSFWILALAGMSGSDAIKGRRDIEIKAISAFRSMDTKSAERAVSEYEDMAESAMNLTVHFKSNSFLREAVDFVCRVCLWEISDPKGDRNKAESLIMRARRLIPEYARSKRVHSEVVTSMGVAIYRSDGGRCDYDAMLETTRLFVQAMELDRNNKYAEGYVREVLKLISNNAALRGKAEQLRNLLDQPNGGVL